MSVSKFMKRNSILTDSSYEFLNSDLIESHPITRIVPCPVFRYILWDMATDRTNLKHQVSVRALPVGSAFVFLQTR